MFELEEIPFDHVIQALLDTEKAFPARFIYRLSDIAPEESRSLQAAWPKTDLQRRQAVMEDVQTMSEDDTLLDFTALSQLALKDPDGYVRRLAVRTLADYELVELLPDFLYMVEHDPDEEVRAACASALGIFVYKGEIDELSPRKLHKVEDILLRVHQGSDTPLVRRRALESLGYSSRDEIPPLIDRAYALGERDWLLSALNAMGKSSNSIWNSKVAENLNDRRANVRAEAATAAGELGIRSATRRLMELLDDAHEDVRAAAIWALSEVGGEGVRARLEATQEDTEDEDEADLIESALENLSFTEDLAGFSMLELEETEDEDEEDYLEDEDLDEIDFDEDELDENEDDDEV